MKTTVAPPRVLTMEDYQRDWQNQGWQLIIIGPTSTWRQDWGEWEAIRDIVQNALDEAEGYRYGYDENGLWIADTGSGLAVADFLLGPPKLKPEYARGRFGEGMKIAALALLRKGYSVHVETVGKELWLVFLEQKVNGSAQTLAALWKANGTRQGTRFHIIGYKGPAFAERFAVNLPGERILAEGPSLLSHPVRRFNQLIRSESGSKIFARDIYMRDINSPFSYNLWSFPMAPDRHGPKNETDLWIDMGRLWCCVTRTELIETLIKMVRLPPEIQAEESQNLNMDPWSLGTEPSTGKRYADFIKENAASWQQAWRNVCGDEAVIRTDERWDGTVRHLGYLPVSVSWYVKDALSKAIITDADLVKASQERLRQAQVVPDQRLSARQLAHLKLARAIALKVSPYRPVAGVHAALIPPASDRVRTAGLYGRTTEEVFISSDQLESGRSTVDTVIHELAHHTSGAEDLEERHSSEMSRIAGLVVKLTHEGAFDELMKEVVW